MSLKLFTTDTYDQKAYTPLGFVRGTMVHAVSFFRDIVGGVTAIFGGANSAINKKIDDTHDEAIKELVKYTMNTYPSATAIAGISISLTQTVVRPGSNKGKNRIKAPKIPTCHSPSRKGG